MSPESREAYLVDLISDLSYSLSQRLDKKDIEGYLFDSDLVNFANQAVNQYKIRKG